MLRRLFAGGEAPVQTTDQLPLVEKLVKLPTFSERSQFILGHLASGLSGDVRGYVVRLGGEAAQFEAVHGYAPAMLELELVNGPWRDPRPRLINNLVAELFTPNSQATRAILGDLGLRDAKSSLIAPLDSRESVYGALLLHHHDERTFSEDDLTRVRRWGSVLGGVQAAHAESQLARRSLIEFTRAFTEAIESQDFSQLGHASRVTAYALAMGRALGFDKQELADLYFAAMLHDVGKVGSGLEIAVEDSNHPQRGANLIASSPLLARATEGVRAHHENWDGSGFPLGLRKDEIPTLGRIVAVADTFDLLSSERGQSLPLHEVEKSLELRAGRELEPGLVNLFINILRQGKSTAELGRLESQDLPF